ncbi:MAG: hypothetical protein PF437_08215 [Sulfurimonas sp.]|nr:hypothetical protein [Sulfurimonas sp.]
MSSLISEFIIQEFGSMVYSDTDGNTYFIFEESDFLVLIKII